MLEGRCEILQKLDISSSRSSRMRTHHSHVLEVRLSDLRYDRRNWSRSRASKHELLWKHHGRRLPLPHHSSRRNHALPSLWQKRALERRHILLDHVNHHLAQLLPRLHAPLQTNLSLDQERPDFQVPDIAWGGAWTRLSTDEEASQRESLHKRREEKNNLCRRRNERDRCWAVEINIHKREEQSDHGAQFVQRMLLATDRPIRIGLTSPTFQSSRRHASWAARTKYGGRKQIIWRCRTISKI